MQWTGVSGRRKNGENLMICCRDSGSGTRNGYWNPRGLDPSWGYGENVGPRTVNAATTLLDPNFQAANRGGSGTLEGSVRNHRLAWGHTGAERGVGGTSSYLSAGRSEIVAERNDIDPNNQGVGFFRPTTTAIVNNSTVESYRLGSNGSLLSLGDKFAEPFPELVAPLVSPAVAALYSAPTPKMENPWAAAYLNNIFLSVAAFDEADLGDPSLDQTPGEFIATRFILASSKDYVQEELDPTGWIPNVAFNAGLKNLALTNPGNVLNDPGFATYGFYTTSGLVPTRTAGLDYGDGAFPSNVYRRLNGNSLTYGNPLPAGDRNILCGDTNDDGVRDINDAASLVLLFRVRDEGNINLWPANDRTISPEIIADFTGDGRFDIEDLRYWADGLALDPSNGGNLNRFEGFRRLDAAFPGGNIFGTTINGSAALYEAGFSAADIAGGSVLPMKGFVPTGSDGNVDLADVDYVGRNFGDFTILEEAARMDLSADMNGDLLVNIDDLCFVVSTVLGTRLGDLNLDGVVDATDLAILQANLGTGSTYAEGDLNFDGVNDAADLDLMNDYIAGINPCDPVVTPTCPADINGDATGAFDLRLAWIASRDHTIWMAMQFENPVDLFEGSPDDGTIRQEITLPDRRTVMIDFREPAYRVVKGTGAQQTFEPIHWNDIDFRVMPAQTSRRFKLQFNLQGQGVEVGDLLEIRFTGSDTLEEPIRFRMAESRLALAPRPVGPSEITPPKERAIRIASYNTAGAGLVSPTDPRRRDQIERTVRAARAVIYCFQGETTTTPDTIRRRMQGIDPLDNAGEWNAAILAGSVIATQFPIIELPALQGISVAGAIVLTGDNADRPIVIYSADFPCCGGTGSSEDERRIDSADLIANQIIALREGQLGDAYAPYADAPVVLAGSLNIVGSTLPRFVLEDSAKLRFAELPSMLTDALETWHDDRSPRPPAVRDHIAMTEGLDIAHGFVVNIRRLGPVLARQSGMHRADFEATPHMMLIANCVPRDPTR